DSRGIDLPGLRTALSAYPDDDDGSAAWWRADDAGGRRRLGASPTARLHHRRRPRSVADSHTLYDAGRLHLPRPAADLDVRGKEGRRGAAARRMTGNRPPSCLCHAPTIDGGPDIGAMLRVRTCVGPILKV